MTPKNMPNNEGSSADISLCVRSDHHYF